VSWPRLALDNPTQRAATRSFLLARRCELCSDFPGGKGVVNSSSNTHRAGRSGFPHPDSELHLAAAGVPARGLRRRRHPVERRRSSGEGHSLYDDTPHICDRRGKPKLRADCGQSRDAVPELAAAAGGGGDPVLLQHLRFAGIVDVANGGAVRHRRRETGRRVSTWTTLCARC
jgi:hypothetical protein